MVAIIIATMLMQVKQLFGVSYVKLQCCDLQLKNTENERRPLGGNRMTFAYHPASTWEKART